MLSKLNALVNELSIILKRKRVERAEEVSRPLLPTGLFRPPISSSSTTCGMENILAIATNQVTHSSSVHTALPAPMSEKPPEVT